MTGRARVLMPLLVLLAVALVAVTGCRGDTGQSETTGSQETSQTMKLEVVTQWLESAHARPVTTAATREPCKNCHDGETYRAQQSKEPTPSSESTAPRDWIVATDCRVCHTAGGAEIADSGTTELVDGKSVKAGTGAVCVSCHNSWNPPRRIGEGGHSAPHESVQGSVLYASGVATLTKSPAAGQNPHQRAQDTCVGCHVTRSPVPGSKPKAAVPDHTMTFKDSGGCVGGDCHEKDALKSPAAKDYDGNGEKESFQAEVEGLLGQLKSEIEAKAGGTFESSRGEIVFAKGARPTPEIFAATYNYLMVTNDRSKGVHNPAFVIALLQNSISEVGGTVGRTGSTGGTGGSGGTGGGGTGGTGGSGGTGGTTGTPNATPTP